MIAGPTQFKPHVLGAARLVVRPHLLAQRGLLPDAGVGAAELARPAHRQQVLLGEPPAEGVGDVLAGPALTKAPWKPAGRSSSIIRRSFRRSSRTASPSAKVIGWAASSRQPQDALADDVALDLGGAAVDRRAERLDLAGGDPRRTWA